MALSHARQLTNRTSAVLVQKARFGLRKVRGPSSVRVYLHRLPQVGLLLRAPGELLADDCALEIRVVPASIRFAQMVNLFQLLAGRLSRYDLLVVKPCAASIGVDIDGKHLHRLPTYLLQVLLTHDIFEYSINKYAFYIK